MASCFAPKHKVTSDPAQLRANPPVLESSILILFTNERSFDSKLASMSRGTAATPKASDTQRSSCCWVWLNCSRSASTTEAKTTGLERKWTRQEYLSVGIKCCRPSPLRPTSSHFVELGYCASSHGLPLVT